MLGRVKDERARYEKQFRRAGLPLLIAGRTAATDVWTRVWPVLALVFWAELLGALDLSWSFWENVAALAGGITILALAWALGNRARGRPALARPRDIDTYELGGFVIIPALLPAVLNAQPMSALVTALGNLTLLAVLYGVVGYGLLSIVAWTGRRTFSQLATSLMLFARAIPLLLLFSIVLFLTTEMWQVFAPMEGGRLAANAGLLVFAGTVFLLVRIPREVRALEIEVVAGPPLDRRQRLNVGLVLFVAQALQALVVTVAVGAFFVLFGALALDGAVVSLWSGHAVEALFHERVAGISVIITQEHLFVASMIAALSGLYYSIAVLTDSAYREEFLSELTGEMRDTFSDRARYLALPGVAI